MNIQNFTPNVPRLMLLPHEVCRLPETASTVYVVMGQAWITTAGKDIIAACGETYPVGKDAVISSVGKTPLILEIVGH